MSINLNILETEQRNENSKNIDTMNTIDILKTINNEDQKIADAVALTIPSISDLVDQIAERMKQGGRVIYMGAGTSGRLGVLDASECPPTYGVSADLIQGLIAGGVEALLVAKEGAEDSKELAKQDLESVKINKQDTIIGLAASGRTPYVIGGLQYAKEIGALTGSISCVSNSEIGKNADHVIEVICGPEVVTGSTRMKSGTAQKLVLNMISTSLMIKYGKVFQNLMVDVQPTNLKLIERAKGIIMHASDCSIEEATNYFEESGQNVKVAICMAITKKDKDTCLSLLQTNDGNVSQTIHNLIK
ncbi:MAG: N-acetylmuramic acid 6-phosphate etherase [Coprobacillaceae bacterium]